MAPMGPLDRRSFLQKASLGLGGTAAVLVAVDPAHAASRQDTDRLSEVAASDQRVVAFVKSGSRDRVTILVGEREIEHRDPRLARLLLRAAR